MARIFLVFNCTCSHYEIKNKLYIKDLNFELKKNILNLSYQKETISTFRSRIDSSWTICYCI